LLADDNELIATEIRRLIEPSFDVIGVLRSGEELEAAYEKHSPDVVVTDIAMPGEGGLTAAKSILDRHPGARIVLLSMIDSATMIRLGLSVGVLGYVLKEDVGEELLQAIKTALKGKPYLSASARRSLV
jgi:two-component system NarL family response regulator